METIILPAREIFYTTETRIDLLWLPRLRVEHFLIGMVRPTGNDPTAYLLYDSFRFKTSDSESRLEYDRALSGLPFELVPSLGFPGAYKNRHFYTPRIFNAIECIAPQSEQGITGVQYQELSQSFCIPSEFLPVVKDVVDLLWSRGLETITVHNHPAIPSSSLDEETSDNLRMLYDLSDKRLNFQAFVEEHLRTVQTTPSEADLAITRQLSNKGIGLIAVGKNNLSSPETTDNPNPTDYIGFKVLDHNYEEVPICLASPKDKPESLIQILIKS